MGALVDSGRRRAAVVLVSATLAGGLVYGGHAALTPPRLTDPADTTEALAPPSGSAGSAGEVPSGASGARPGAAPGTRSAAPPEVAKEAGPSQVEIPSLDATLPVVPVGVDEDEVMSIPEDPSTAGWYRFGPRPTSPSGASVLAAHSDTAGGTGPFSRLDHLEQGDRIRLTVGDELLVYDVTRVDHHAKKVLDLDALFSRTGPPRLHLVSCGGEWDAASRSYEDNVVVVAVRTTDPRAHAYGGSSEG